MKALTYTVSALVFAALGFGGMMLVAYSGFRPCDTCRALLTPYQGGLVNAQMMGVMVGGIIGITVAWWVNRRMTQ